MHALGLSVLPFTSFSGTGLFSVTHISSILFRERLHFEGYLGLVFFGDNLLKRGKTLRAQYCIAVLSFHNPLQLRADDGRCKHRE